MVQRIRMKKSKMEEDNVDVEIVKASRSKAVRNAEPVIKEETQEIDVDGHTAEGGDDEEHSFEVHDENVVLTPGNYMESFEVRGVETSTEGK